MTARAKVQWLIRGNNVPYNLGFCRMHTVRTLVCQCLFQKWILLEGFIYVNH